MLTLSSIEPEMNGFGRYRAVTREFFHAKTAYFCQLNARKRVPFHPGVASYPDPLREGERAWYTLCVHVLVSQQTLGIVFMPIYYSENVTLDFSC